MKRVLSVLVTMAVVAMMMAGCTGPFESADESGSAVIANGISRVISGADQTIYLKGSGNHFDESGWSPVFRVAGDQIQADYALGKTPETWHLVYTGKDFEAVSSMQIAFTNGEVFTWTPDMGPSRNGGGNNPGWVIQAPYGWKIAYIDKGNNNESDSFLVTAETDNINFNISGYKAGTSTTPVVPPVVPVKGKIEFTKTVEGIEGSIVNWASISGSNIDALITGFNLYKAEKDGGAYIGARFDFKELNSNGTVLFDNLDDGWYAVEEVLTAEGEKVFEEVPPQYFLITNGITIGGADFDYDAFYTIKNGYGSGYQLGYPGLNNTGDIFYIGVTNATPGSAFSGIEYVSFCANAGSTHFAGESGLGCKGYYVAERIDRTTAEFAEFLLAYNYIEANYGKLLDNRALTQAVTWTLLGAIDINSAAFDAIEDWKLDKAAVKDVMANYRNYTGGGEIVDIVFLTCENHHDYTACQPQLVPVYGENRIFQNTVQAQEPEQPKEGALKVKAQVFTKYDKVTLRDLMEHNEWNIIQRYIGKICQRDVWDIMQGEYQDFYIPVFETITTTTKNCKDNLVTKGCTTHNNGHTCIAIDVDAAKSKHVKYEMAHSGSKNNGNGCYYNVKITGNKINISFDDKCKSIKYNACVVNNPSHFSGYSSQHHNTGKSCTFNMPTGHGKTVYLFLHVESGSEWYSHDTTTTTTTTYKFKEWILLERVWGEEVIVGEGSTKYELVSTDMVYSEVTKVQSKCTVYATEEYARVTMNKAYDGKITLKVINEADEVVSEGDFTSGKVLEGLSEGYYTVILSSKDFEKAEKVLVEADKTAVVNFGTFIGNKGPDVFTAKAAAICNKVNTLSDVTLPDKVVEETKIDNRVDSKILDPKQLKDVYLGDKDDPFGEYAIRL